MKTLKIFTILCGFTATMLFTSCDEFLSPYNPQGVTEEMLYQTEDGFESGVNASYSYLRKLWGMKQGTYLMEAGTDLWTTGSEAEATDLIYYSGLSGSNDYIASNLWSNSYYAINQCNTMLKYVEFAKPQVRTAREAELKVLRSYFWWILTENFGNIHFTTEPNSGGNTLGIKTSPDKVYEQIFKDLEFAAQGSNLPNTSTDLGRITKPVAEALLARMYLTRGRNAEAITYAKNVINNYNYQLEPIDNLWRLSTQRSNKEAIWTINRHANNNFNGSVEFLNGVYAPKYYNLTKEGTKFGFSNSNLNNIDGMSAMGRLMPTYRLLSLYDQANDARFEATFKNTWRANDNSPGIVGQLAYPKWTLAEATEYGNPTLAGKSRFTNGDTSVVLIFNNPAAKRFPKVRYNTLDENDLYDATTKVPKERRIYFQLLKHFDPQAASSTITTRDFFMIRLSEMYLIIAEADFRLKGANATEGLKALNDLRAKRAKPGASVAFTNVQTIPNIDFILDERARELCGEQLRWFDLKRTGKLVEYVSSFNPDADIQDFHVLRPYPTAQVQLMSNSGDFVQEGY